MFNIFGSKSRTLTQQNSRFFFINQFCTFCVNPLCNEILLMHKTYRPSISIVLLQLRDLISENMKISKVKIVGKGGLVQNYFSKKNTSTLTYCFYQLVEFSIKFPVIYVNVKKIYQKFKTLPKTSLMKIVCCQKMNSMYLCIFPKCATIRSEYLYS